MIAFTDSDCSPHPSWASAGLAALDADPDLGMVCGVTEPPALPARPWSKNITVRDFTWRFESCNVIFRREAFGPRGAFDEVVGDGWEDTAAGFEILRRGWQVGFCADAVVLHDVTYPGFWFHVRREQRQANLGHVVRRYPELRGRLLYARVFLNSRQAAAFLAAVGQAGGLLRPRARLLALPYLAFLLPRVLPWRMAQLVILDVTMHVAIIRGAIRYRAFVL